MVTESIRTVMRYGGRYQPLDKSNPSTGDYLNFRPLMYDIYMRPGAIYWLEKRVNTTRKNGEKVTEAIGWDINYFTFDFNYISSANVFSPNNSNNSDACFVRCVEK